MVSAKKPTNVEETTWLAKKQNIGPARCVILHLVPKHRFRDFRIVIGKFPAEPAAGIRHVQGNKLRTFHRLDKFFRLLGNSQNSGDMTGIMKGHLPFKSSLNISSSAWAWTASRIGVGCSICHSPTIKA